MIAWIGFLCISFFIFRSMHMPLICGVFFFVSVFASLLSPPCFSVCVYRAALSVVQFAVHQWERQWCRGIEVIFDGRVCFFFSLHFSVLVFVSLISFISPAQNALHCSHYINYLRSPSVTKNRVYFSLVDDLSFEFIVDESTGRGVRVYLQIQLLITSLNITEKLVNHIIVDDRFSFYGALVWPNGDAGDSNRFS